VIAEHRPLMLLAQKLAMSLGGSPQESWKVRGDVKLASEERRVIADLRHRQLPHWRDAVGILRDANPDRGDEFDDSAELRSSRMVLAELRQAAWKSPATLNELLSFRKSHRAAFAEKATAAPSSSTGAATAVAATPAALASVRPGSSAGAGALPSLMSQALQDILTWETNTMADSEGAKGGAQGPQTSLGQLMETFEIASAVSPTISMWCLVRMWASYHEIIHKFLIDVR
jgi:hypothetical protein